MGTSRGSTSTTMRQARQAWNLLHVDSTRARSLAERAIAAATRSSDLRAQGWARLTIGVHLLYYGTAIEAAAALRRACHCLATCHDRGGELLANAAIARALWREGRVDDALAHVLPLRDEGVRLLRHEQRGLLLNTIAGCYSALGDSSQAFAYMYEALRDASPRNGRGFDVVLHCNLAHELAQIGDYEHALLHVDQGLTRCQTLKNARLDSVLRLNRIICLTELGRAGDCLADVEQVLAIPADPDGRGAMGAEYETLALTALRGGRLDLGAELVARALAEPEPALADERLERQIAAALLELLRGRADVAERTLLPHLPQALLATQGLSVRMQAQFFALLGEVREARGDAAGALDAMRQWQRLHRAQAQLASRARFQAAALQTELLRMQQRLEEQDARRRATERARAELAAINQELTQRVEQVQSLQDALRQQATQDPLTGLFNRRHLNDALPTLFALAARDGQAMSLAVLDLDHFKDVNDAHGHLAGDRLLAAFGELLVAHGRRSDVACRFGGEEFCLLMPRTSAEQARRKVAILLRRWSASQFDLNGVAVTGLSFSAGVADTAQAPGSPDALLKLADDRCLQAKRAGRGRVLASAAAAKAIGTTSDDLR